MSSQSKDLAAQAQRFYASRTTFDGKRMRKAITRRTLEYTSSFVRMRENRILEELKRPIQPNPAHIIEYMPPQAYIDQPINAVATSFVHMSLNKVRCPINVVRWTPEGRRLLTGASTGEFTLWNGSTFNFETILQAHDTSIRAMTWSNNSNFLITGDHGGIIKFWQPSMNNLKVLDAHKEPVRSLTFSPNDSKFASCSDDGMIKIWDFAEAHEERSLTGHGWDVKNIHWHPYKSLLASGSKDNLVKLWDPKSGANLATIHGHKNTILDLKWNKNGNWLLTSGKDQLIKLYDIRMMRELQTFRGHKREVNTVAWHPIHETLFASGCADGSIMYWLTGNENNVGCLESAHDSSVWSLDWHPVGHLLCSGSNDHAARFWTRPRPADPLKDRYILGRQAAEALGIKEIEQPQADEDNNELPGMGIVSRQTPIDNHQRQNHRFNHHGPPANMKHPRYNLPPPPGVVRQPPLPHGASMNRAPPPPPPGIQVPPRPGAYLPPGMSGFPRPPPPPYNVSQHYPPPPPPPLRNIDPRLQNMPPPPPPPSEMMSRDPRYRPYPPPPPRR